MNQKFQDFFKSVYGDRWPQIWEALQQPSKFALRKNKYAGDISLENKIDFLKDCAWFNGETLNINESSGLKDYYKMDPASVIVAHCLKFSQEDSVLDLCAAPGGKSLILAEKLDGAGELISNEISASRRDRLTRVFHEYLPKDKRMNCFIKGADGNQFGLKYAEHFNAVLSDVPCSGERHLVENKAEFEVWTERRSQNLAVRQYSLLSSAWLACQNEGRIVYSTCSISPYENDEVIKKLIKRRGVKVLSFEEAVDKEFVDPSKINFLEKTEHGYQVLPDRSGFGPMYFSCLQK